MILIFRQLILIIIFAGLFSHLIGCSLFSPPSPESLELAEVQIHKHTVVFVHLCKKRIVLFDTLIESMST